MPAPEIVEDADLASLSSFALPARAERLIAIEQVEQLAGLDPEPCTLVLGGGSNTVFLNDWPGTILLNRLGGITAERLDDQHVRVRAAAGENWHGLVRWCLDRGYHGLENLILIPGSVGAAPMQNIGAYGVELSDVLESVSAWEWASGRLIEIPAADCALCYRDSRFKSADRGRFLITSVSLRLQRQFEPGLGYESLLEHLGRRGISSPTPRQLAAAVMRLRRHRLPDPARLPNAGSFFKNPVVGKAQAETLLAQHPRLPHWRLADGSVKLAAGWMIEQLGLKGQRIGDAGIYRKHALVLVNHGRATANQLRELISKITGSVAAEFGIHLEIEPNLIGF